LKELLAPEGQLTAEELASVSKGYEGSQKAAMREWRHSDDQSVIGKTLRDTSETAGNSLAASCPLSVSRCWPPRPLRVSKRDILRQGTKSSAVRVATGPQEIPSRSKAFA
jgi:hypothetical protein